VSDRDRLPQPLAAVIKRIDAAATSDEERASTFARGLALGVLVGAAIAGSTLWQRRHASPRTVPADDMNDLGARGSPSLLRGE
jgi:hypothetical protein